MADEELTPQADEPNVPEPGDSAEITPEASASPAEPDGGHPTLIDQAELDALMVSMTQQQSGAPAETSKSTPAEVSKSAPAQTPEDSAMSDLEAEMAAAIAAEAQAAAQQAEPEPVAAASQPAHEVGPAMLGSTAPAPVTATAAPVAMPDFNSAGAADAGTQIDLLDDVELDVKIELGRTQMYIEDVLRLGEGSVVSLDKLAGDPVDIYVNERLVARGEVLVLNENFCVRVNDIINPTDEEDEK
ncbi:MAG: flagellar motor switch protein FliN [Phycisphaerae bacterium]|jgi:flagellar motor switch protein FliN/FliY